MKLLLLFVFQQSLFHQITHTQALLIPNVMLQPSGNTTVQADTSLTLTCNATQYTPGALEIQWIGPRGESLIVTDNNSGLNLTNDTLTSTLVFSNIRTSQAGAYTCQINLTEIPDSPNVTEVVIQSTTIFVQIPTPEVTLSFSHDHTIYEGTDVSLVCYAIFNNTGVDTAISFDEQLISESTTNSTSRRTLRESQTADTIMIQLDIAPVDLSDNGVYTCTAEAQSATEFVVGGKGEDSVNLTVSGLPLPSVETSAPSNAIIGLPFSLTCVVTVVEHLVVEPSILWTNSDGQVVTEAESVITQLDDYTYQLVLSFDQLLASQTGRYTCTGTVGIPVIGVVNHTASNSIELAATIPPPLVTMETNQLAYHGTNHMLSCSVEIEMSVNIPVLTSFTWLGPSSNIPLTQDQFFSIVSKGTHSVLTLTPVMEPSVSSGVYRCQVSIAAEEDTYIDSASGIDAITLITQAPLPPLATIDTTRDSNCAPVTSITCSGSIEVSLGVPLEYSWTDPIGQMLLEDTIHFTEIIPNVSGLYRCQACVSVAEVNLTDLCGSTTITILNTAPGSVLDMHCPFIGQQEALVVDWSPPVNSTAAVLGYLVEVRQYVQTGEHENKLVSVEELSPPFSAQIPAPAAYIPTLYPGVRYILSVSAIGTSGCGHAESTECFTAQQTPDIISDIFVDRLSASVMNVSWVPLTVVEARGFLTMYTVYYSKFAHENSIARSKRQSSTDLNIKIVSPISSSVLIDGLNEESNYGVQVLAQNAAGLMSNNDLSPRIFSGIYTSTEDPPADNSSAITGGVIGAILIAALSAVTLVIAALVYKFKSRRGNDVYDDQRSPPNTYAHPSIMSPSMYDLPQFNRLYRDQCPQYEDIGVFQAQAPADYEVACSTLRRPENEPDKVSEESHMDCIGYGNLLAIQESDSCMECSSDTHSNA